jgi:hypothetical protein
MAWGPPNLVDAAFPAQAKLWNSDLDTLALAAGGVTGVVSGCAVTTNGNMTLAVAAGTVKVAAAAASVTGGNVTVTAAHATLDRIDLVVVNSSGTKSVTAGTAASTPVQPAIPASSVCLAQIYVPAADTVIGATQIIERRVFVPAVPAAQGWNTLSKAADQTKTSDATFANDNTLLFTAGASTKYRVRASIWIDTSANADFKWQLSGPAAPTLVGIHQTQFNATSGLATSATFDTAFSTSHAIAFTSAFVDRLEFSGILHIAGTGGTVAFQWAQNTVDASNTIVRAGSYLEYSVA